MGEGEKTVQVTIKFGGDIFLLLNVLSEIRPLLIDADLDFESGIIIFCEDGRKVVELQKSMINAGAEYVKNLGKNDSKIRNNQIGLHVYFKYDREADIIDFLKNDGFTPVILLGGVMPELLQEWSNVIVFERDMDIQMLRVLENFQRFVAYAHKNSNAIQKALKLFQTSEIFLQNTSNSMFHISLEAAAEIFCNYYREGHTELKTVQKRRNLSQEIVHVMGISEIYAEKFDSCDMVRKAVLNYVDENLQIQIGKVDDIDGAMTKAIEREEAILLDTEYYFIPEKILRCACESFRDVASILSVKKALWEEGHLCCNGTKEANFTVKKTVINAYGQCFRPRFLKMRRDFFESQDSLGLQERRNICTAEALADSHVG